MCDYINEIHEACRQLAEKETSFDMLQVRNKVRELTGPSVMVMFKPCKFEALAFFEQGGLPGWILSTKTITTDEVERTVFVFLHSQSLVESVFKQLTAPSLN